MAARMRKSHQEDVRAKIQASQLINFLQKHALEGGTVDTTRVDAAKFLLNKAIANPPSETNTNLSGGLTFGWQS